MGYLFLCNWDLKIQIVHLSLACSYKRFCSVSRMRNIKRRICDDHGYKITAAQRTNHHVFNHFTTSNPSCYFRFILFQTEFIIEDDKRSHSLSLPLLSIKIFKCTDSWTNVEPWKRNIIHCMTTTKLSKRILFKGNRIAMNSWWIRIKLFWLMFSIKLIK